MAETKKKVTMEKVEINGVVRTEKLRLADIAAILNGEERSDEIIADLKNYVAHKAAQVENRKSSSSKDDEEKAARKKAIREAILAFLTENKGKWYQVTAIIKGSPALGLEYSTSEVTTVITALKDEGLVVREVEKRKPLYTIAATAE